MNANRKQPLRAEVKDGRLVVSIGLEVLVFASRLENGGPEKLYAAANGEACVVDGRRERAWAKDVVAEMCREDEVGNCPLNEFLDDMMVAAAQSGSIACNYKKLRRSKE